VNPYNFYTPIYLESIIENLLRVGYFVHAITNCEISSLHHIVISRDTGKDGAGKCSICDDTKWVGYSTVM
jgi:hypothetical protein